MSKEGWCDGLGQEWVVCMSRGKCLKYLKSGGNRKEGRRNQNFKRGEAS